MNSLILRTMAPFLTGLMLVFSLFITLRGHNAPGGGFIGGLLAASAVAVYALAFGVTRTRRVLRLHPLTIAGMGLLLSAVSGLVSMLYGVPYMTGIWFHVAGLDLATVMSFDIGVYLVVLGAFSSILLALEEKGGRLMEVPFAILSGLFFAAAIYLMLSRHIIRIMLGVALLGNAVNLLLFTAGRITRETPPVIVTGSVLPASAANPLPQALILTAIVISFCFFAFLMVLAYRAWQALGTDDTAAMRVAEPIDEAMPPVGY